MSLPDLKGRNERLGELLTKTKEFAKSEKTRLENENKFIRAVMQGWGISEAAAQNLTKGKLKAIEEIEDFLTG